MDGTRQKLYNSHKNLLPIITHILHKKLVKQTNYANDTFCSWHGGLKIIILSILI